MPVLIPAEPLPLARAVTAPDCVAPPATSAVPNTLLALKPLLALTLLTPSCSAVTPVVWFCTAKDWSAPAVPTRKLPRFNGDGLLGVALPTASADTAPPLMLMICVLTLSKLLTTAIF